MKFYYFSTVIVSSSITYILLNNSNIAYFLHNVFKLNQTFILLGCHEVLCVYDMTLVLLKWNGKMLVKWLSDQFWRYCLCIYVLIETADAEITASVISETRERRAEHAGLLFKSTFLA